MKKISLLFATLLVLVSSIVFCSCNEGYKNVKITCSTKKIELVLDDEQMSITEVVFELSGAKSWGEVSVVSEPAGKVQTAYETQGKKCVVGVKALQTCEGANLVVTHLGSGVKCKVPLNIGERLKNLINQNNDFIIQLPKFTEEELNNGIEDVKQIEIPTKKLVTTDPLHCSDIVVWQSATATLPEGIQVVSYNASGERLTSAFEYMTQMPDQNNVNKHSGKSNAVQTVIEIGENYVPNTSFTINPISLLGKDAILHKDIEVDVNLIDLLNEEDIVKTSTTHGNGTEANILEDLVLISNPDANNKRVIEGLSGYDYFSTGLIDLKVAVIKYPDDPTSIVYEDLHEVNPMFAQLYDMKITSNLDGLRLEKINFGKLRVFAPETCVGSGNIVVSFEPKDCVGDIKAFSVTIPCEVGKRATGFEATNNGEKIDIKNIDGYKFSSMTPLNDSNSYGQIFRFGVLDTDTLEALTGYRITINKYLLYIDKSTIDESTNTSVFITNGDDGKNTDLTDVLNNKFEYQISILKDGRQIKFTYDGTKGVFVSELLTARNNIYMKWEKVVGHALDNTSFGITVRNCYDDRYNIANNQFENTILTYDIEFDRQRTIERISYLPIKVTTEPILEDQKATDSKEDWQFYFTPEMLENAEEVYYGLVIENVFGLNGSTLTDEELKNINLQISINSQAIGLDLLKLEYDNINKKDVVNVDTNSNCYIFNYDSNANYYRNIIILGKIDGQEIGYGNYQLTITQNNNLLASRDLRVYRNLEEKDVKITIPTADFEGELLQYEYEYLANEPENWGGGNYYELVGGQYIIADNTQFNPSKSYYKKVDVLVLKGTEKEKLDLDKTYILSTANQYNVKIEIDNEDFGSITEQNFVKTMLSNSGEVLVGNYINYNEYRNVISTTINGLFNSKTNEKNYIQLTYEVKSNTYDYYKVNTDKPISIEKDIYIYIYKPLTSAVFSDTMLYKYDYKSIPNSQHKQEYGKETLNIKLNNNDIDMLNYVDIKWFYDVDGIDGFDFDYTQKDKATFTFDISKNIVDDRVITGRIIATLTQFGVQFPINCNYEVKRPVLSDQVIFNTPVNSFKNGNSYINLKVGEELQLDATAKSSKGEVSFNEFVYVICSPMGYSSTGIASVDENGKLTAEGAGKAKLIVIAKDQLTNNSLTGITNYFNTGLYIANKSYLMIDIIVSDGSEQNPYLIASAKDFRNIASDYVDNVNNKHYALVADIDLGGQSLSFGTFTGTISSFQENDNTNNRFSVYGIMLDEQNPTLFKQLGTASSTKDDLYFENIDFYVDINYKTTKQQLDDKQKLADILIGLVGINYGKIEDVTVTISGKVNANNLANKYIIGSMVATNAGTGSIVISNTELVGVNGDIVVENSSLASVYLGGVIGVNEGELIGANREPEIQDGENEVKYDVYYDNQGATADIKLQVQSVDTKNIDNSAVGGLVGYNKGIIANAYSMGSILGVDDANNLTVNNIGGLIGKNNGNITIYPTIDTTIFDNLDAVKYVSYAENQIFQINNSYSSAQVMGKDNVGGAVGLDNKGSYKKVYYENYKVQTAVKGNNNVGGLIGSATDSSLYYCYANSFVLNYKSSVEVYDIVGATNVGGLIGLANADSSSFENSKMSVVSSLASVSISGSYNVSGIIGKLNNYGAIYTAYYYGVIDPSVDLAYKHAITKMYSGNAQITNLSYNNTYAIVNGEELVNIVNGNINANAVFNKVDNVIILNNGVAGFNRNDQYNNGYPYIEYTYTDKDNNVITTNLVNAVPTVIQINDAFEQPDKDKLYVENNMGDYVKIDGQYIVYNPSNTEHQNLQRYSLMAQIIDTNDLSGNLSDYRGKALVLYYYKFTEISDDQALNAMNELNTINMHDIVSDDGIIVLPNSLKRFNLRTSNSGVVSVLNGGKLLLHNEGQATITLVSTLNPSVTASFVIIVRSKVLEFNLHSSADLSESTNVANSTINIVKGSSKLLYANYASTIESYARKYKYAPATNTKVEFKIEYLGTETEVKENILNYIRLNSDYYNESTGTYLIPYTTPITISIYEYATGEFKITAIPYVVANYVNGSFKSDIDIELSQYFEVNFKVATKKGASAINTNKTKLDMMAGDDPSNLDIKVTTDVELDNVKFEIEAQGSKWEYTTYTGEDVNFAEMIDIIGINEIKETDATGKVTRVYGTLPFSEGSFNNDNKLQSLTLNLKLNELSYYVDEEFKLELIFSVENNGNIVSTKVYIDVKPQVISSVIAQSYRLHNEESSPNPIKPENAYSSNVIRPGETNILTIDIAPNIAVYDYVEIMDITAEDKILFQQVKADFTLLKDMDEWVDNGIKLIKVNNEGVRDITASKLYVMAKLPLYSTANITHTIQINTYNKNGKLLDTTYLNLEAIMYPTVVATYTYPNGQEVVVNTIEGKQHEKVGDANLALGVEAEISVVSYNIDAGTLTPSITITDLNNEDVTDRYSSLINLEGDGNTFILRFNHNRQSDWSNLLGKNINVGFLASKTLNGITETCKATIRFNIKHMVIHGISMTHTSSKGDLYGDWGEEFETEFYFDKTDISYYNNGYWNVQYRLDNTSNIDDERIEKINEILTTFNNFNSWGEAIKMYLGSLTEKDVSNMTEIKNSYIPEYELTINNRDNKFIFKAEEGSNINEMKLKVMFGVEYNNNLYPELKEPNEDNRLSKEYGFNITIKTTPFDNYIEISSQEEFEDMLEGKYYRLTTNLEFSNYTPINVAIGGFNGDGYTITIKKKGINDGFNISQLVQDYLGSQMKIGLFGTLAEDSIIQNLKVHYDKINIGLNSETSIEQSHTNNIYFGGIAAENMGVITNVCVSGEFNIISKYISADHIKLGGITATNGKSNVPKVATITGSEVTLELSAIASIGGINETNYGKITNTVFKGKIVSKSNESNQYVAEVTTAGFVVENMNGAYVSLSYVECGLSSGIYNIQSVGRTGGFILNNAGTINNCYINQTSISSQGNIGGFVYQSTGEINNCYSSSTLGSSLFYNEFICSTSNVGTMTNCYVITDNDINIYISGLKRISTALAGNQESYKGFIFAKTTEGLWTITTQGPKLLNSGFNANRNQYDDIFNIYDVETFEGYFKTDSEIIEGKIFRLVRDIDFTAQGFDGNPITFNKTLMANFEGNDMVLKNYNIYKTGLIESVGLFAEIASKNSNTYVRNLILQPSSIKATTANAVGALAGIIDSANIYNVIIDSPNILMLGKNAVGGLAGVIKGSFEIIGISSNISAYASHSVNQSEQYHLYTGKNVTGNTLVDNLVDVSYAGAVAGIVDGYNRANPSMKDRSLDMYYLISNINISNNIILIAQTVGGALGFVGERTLVNNVEYNLQSETLYEGIYVSGGLVGENRGIVQNANIYAYTYNEGTKEYHSTIACFDKYAKINGGIVGLNIGGLVDNCVSDINIYTSKDLATVGGIVGRNIEGSVYNCTIYGTLNAYYVGGIVGSDYSYSTIKDLRAGVGIATIATRIVYKNISNEVNYNSNCFTENYRASNAKFINNTISDKFLNDFISTIGAYYSFNTKYIDDQTVGLVETTSVFGLVLGLTDSQYIATVKYNSDNTTTNYSDKLIVDLAVKDASTEDIRNNIAVEFGDHTITVSPITTINNNKFKYPTELQAIFVYIIAYENASYESWSSTMGYNTNQYVAFIYTGR